MAANDTTNTPEGDRPGSGWVALLARPDRSQDSAAITDQAKQLCDRMRSATPAGLDVESIDPATNDANQVGVLISSSERTLLSQWIGGPGAAEAIGTLGEACGGPVTISSRTGAGATEFPVSYVVTYTVPPANRARFQRWQPSMVAAHLQADGFVAADYHAPLDDDEHEWTVVVRFDTDDHLRSWRASPRRAELVADLETIAEDVEIGRAGLSWAGWFPQPQAAAPGRPRRWKQALATVLPLYPTVMLASTHLAPRLGGEGWGWPGWLVTFAVVSTAVSALTWLLMPNVTKFLAPWLVPAADLASSRDRAWTVGVLASIGSLVLVFALTT